MCIYISTGFIYKHGGPAFVVITLEQRQVVKRKSSRAPRIARGGNAVCFLTAQVLEVRFQESKFPTTIKAFMVP